MEQKTYFILVLGLLRDEHLFKQFLGYVQDLRNIYKITIVISTWDTERETYENVMKMMNITDVHITTTPQLKYNGKSANKNDVKSNYQGYGVYECGTLCDNTCLLQTKNYQKGLKFIREHFDNDKCSYVLKTRTDVYITKEFLNQIFSLDLTINDKYKGIFLEKVWVPFIEINKPFYIGNECFFGRIEDMEKIDTWKFFARQNLYQGVAHIRMFILPFLKRYPIFNSFLKNKYGLNKRMTMRDNRQIYTDKDIIKTYYSTLLAHYYHVMREYL